MEDSVSTDLRSDISFMNRQKELRMLSRDFRSALDTFHSVSPPPTKVSIVQEGEEEEDEYIEEDINDQPLNNDADMILQEIDLMVAETDEIIALISNPKFRQNPRVQTIKKQLIHLQRVNSNLRARAEALRDIEEYGN